MTNLFLFGSFGFPEGMARALDIGTTMVIYNDSPTIEEADDRALNSDWRAIGNDIRNAMKSYAEEEKTA